MQGSQFNELWSSLKTRRQEIQPERCPYAEKLYTWASEYCSKALSDSSSVAIALAMLRLQKKYFEIWSVTPKPHRYLMRPDAAHICLFQVYQTFYEQLLDAELTLTPPLLFLPSSPPPAPLPEPEPEPPQYDGLILGELVDD